MKTSLLLGTTKRLSLLILLTGLLAALSVGSVMADPPTAVTCGSTITAPGQYFLAGDCSGPGITITASDVHLKLDGHTMTGNFPPDSRPGLFAVNVSDVHIQGPGTITSYFIGIAFNVSSDSHVEQVTCVNNPARGLTLFNSTNTHVNNSVFFNSSVGIELFSGSTSNHINGNTALGNVQDLADDNANCDDNKWNGNNFSTSNNPTCIH